MNPRKRGPDKGNVSMRWPWLLQAAQDFNRDLAVPHAPQRNGKDGASRMMMTKYPRERQRLDRLG